MFCILGFTTKIRTWHLPHTTQNRYRLSQTARQLWKKSSTVGTSKSFQVLSFFHPLVQSGMNSVLRDNSGFR
jgi:hypothetical protein